MKIKPIIALAAAVLLLVSVAGCAKKYSADANGKKLGEAVLRPQGCGQRRTKHKSAPADRDREPAR